MPRTLTRTSEGRDVAQFQRAINERLEHIPGGDDFKLRIDGDFGPSTYRAWKYIKPWLGFKLDQKPTPRAQWNLMNPRSRSKAAIARARAYRAAHSKAKPIRVDLVRNYSSRQGVTPRLIVLHCTEGGTLQSVGDMFDDPDSQASSHRGNDAAGNRVLWVRDENKAWTQASYNPQSLSIEQCGFASQKVWPDPQLIATAADIAEWSKKYSIPIRHSTSNGVCQHKDLGAAGGGHDDCGPNYPFDKVLELARSMK